MTMRSGLATRAALSAGVFLLELAGEAPRFLEFLHHFFERRTSRLTVFFSL